MKLKKLSLFIVLFSLQTACMEISLHEAYNSQNMRMVVRLLNDPTTDPNIKDVDGVTLLHVACFERNKILADLLLKNKKTDPNIKDVAGNTPIINAIGREDIEIVRLLANDNRTNLNEQVQLGLTILDATHIFGFSEDHEIVQLLRYKGACYTWRTFLPSIVGYAIGMASVLTASYYFSY